MEYQTTKTIALSLLTPIKTTAIVYIGYTCIVGYCLLSQFSGDGVGDACQDDQDGDGVADGDDVCPLNGRVTITDFTKFQLIDLQNSGGNIQWVILNQVRQAVVLLECTV